MDLQAIIFDVDGTLAETERDGHLPAFNAAFREKGLDWHWDEALYGELLKVTGGKERISYFLKEYYPKIEISDESIAQLHEIKTIRFVQTVNSGALPLRLGVKRLLLEAQQQGIRLAIATTTSIPNVQALLKNQLGENGINWFECIGASSNAKNKKPAADIYQYVLKQMNLHPQDCIAMEDSRNGLLSALGAGITTLITPSFYAQGEDFTEAGLVVDHYGDPDQHFSVIQGQNYGSKWVTVQLLKQLVAAQRKRN